MAPLAKQVVEAELGLALDRRVRAELEGWLDGGAEDDGDTGESGDTSEDGEEGDTCDDGARTV